MNNTVFDYTKSILPLLWKFLDNRKRPCFISMNVYTANDELVISIIDNKKIKRFKSADNQSMIKNLTSYLKVN
jgi:hypothetical protein